MLATLFASATFILIDLDQAFDFFAYFAAHAAVVVAGTWVFRRTRYWQRRSGVSSEWQFSVAQLLVVMTIVALLIITFQSSNLWNDGGDDTATFFGFVGVSSVLAIAATYLWSLSAHWLLRLAGVFAVALGLAAIFLIGGKFVFAYTAANFLIEAAILSVALTLGGILPPAHDASRTLE